VEPAFEVAEADGDGLDPLLVGQILSTLLLDRVAVGSFEPLALVSMRAPL